MSSGRTSRINGPFLRWLKPDVSQETIERVQFVVRKGAHLTEYAILAWLLWRAVRLPRKNDERPWDWRQAVIAFGLAVAYAATDEFHQSFVPSREGHVRDVLIDTFGAVLGLFVVWRAFLARRR
jgi:VanZ family protein